MPPNTSKLANHKSIAEVTVLLVALIFLSGCTLFEGKGQDSSSLRIDHTCDVRLSQAAKAAGMDDADTIETVRVNPDCTTEIDFRQTVGDSVGKIEDEGAEQIMGQGVSKSEGSEQ